MSQDWQERSCPLCDSTLFSKNPEVRAFSPAETMSWDEVQATFIGLRRNQVFFSYYRCLGCGLLYCPRYFSSEQLMVLYSQMPANLMGADKATVSRTQAEYVRWLTNRVSGFNSLLEIGPDVGLMTREVVARVKLSRLSAVEPNLAVHDELRSNARPIESLEIVQYLDEVRNENFDMVIGVHVFDHLLDPLKDLSNLGLISRPGAHIVLVVHNEASTLRKIIKRKWPPFCLQHPQLFNPKSLRDMLDAGGWELQQVGKSTNYFHLNHIVRMTFDVLGFPLLLSKFVPEIELPMNLGNMIVIGKKK